MSAGGRTGSKFAKFAGILILCLGSLCSMSASTAQAQHKTKKPQPAPLPPLPSGPQGPVPQVPLDSIAPVPPQVNFQNGELSILAPNSTLSDILRAVRKQTGAEIEIPPANERVVTRLGPGPVRQVMADLLNGSRFNYVLLGSPQDSNLLTRVVLVAKTGPDTTGAQPGPPQPGPMQAGNVMPPQDAGAEAAETDVPEENGDENAEQAEQPEQPEQPAASPDQPAVKTPQQMLQEMQQRQLQMQQQQNPGQPLPVPPTGRPPQDQ